MTDTSTPAPRGALFGQRLVIGLVIAGLVILADQVLKLWLMGLVLEPRRTIGIFDTGPFLFQILPVWNRGVSFGMFAGEWGFGWLAGPNALSAFAILISIMLLVWMIRAERTLLLVSLALVLGGAVGNVIDRLRYGAVFDFLDFAINGWHPFVFNLADAAISFGVILLLWDSLVGAGKATK